MDYDIIIAGGGIAGSTLGFCASRIGARVLIVEAAAAFRDRVRGEGLHPWGVVEAQRLGVLEVLQNAPAHAATYWDMYLGGMLIDRTHLPQTTSSGLPGYNVHHPELEAALLTAAEAAGAHVRRGVKVARIEPGEPVSVELAGERFSTKLAVVADGRNSGLRKQLGIELDGALSPLLTTGALLEGVSCDRSAVGMFIEANGASLATLFPLPDGRLRLYYVQSRSSRRQRFSGASDVSALIERCISIGIPRATFEAARVTGPLATFDTTCLARGDSALPVGIALLGDAAGNVDPAFGCGQSLALRDVRTLLEAYRSSGDWQLAAARYAEQRRAYHASLLRVEAFMTRILFTPSPEGDALRVVTGPRLGALGINLFGPGPDSPTDADTEARLFEGFGV